ncbi:hypothetical protein NMY22_g5006 [Coprinellus aureogranulatus]|nr:hypothetical protein NMY22_g5006 [Coprinellus aureogranulatus]
MTVPPTMLPAAPALETALDGANACPKHLETETSYGSQNDVAEEDQGLESHVPSFQTTLRCPALSEKLSFDIQEQIAGALHDDDDSLRALSLTSGGLNAASRPFLFRIVAVISAARLRDLDELLFSPQGSTVPRHAEALIVHLPSPSSTDSEYEANSIRGSLWNLFHHYHNVKTLLSLDLPWIISRHGVIWDYMCGYRSLKKFVLRGTYSSFRELIKVLPHLRSLESLVVDAAWKDKGYAPGQMAAISTRLRELALSGSNLALLPWMCSLQTDPQINLHLLRIKVDGVASHLMAFQSIRPFFEKFGSRVAHFYVWLEECPDSVYRELGTALTFAPDLYQLALFLPSDRFQHDPEIERCTNAILVGREFPLTEIWDAFEVRNEGDFWAEPSADCTREGAHVRVE